MRDSLKAVSILLRATHNLEELLRQDIASYGLNPTEFGTLELLYHQGEQPMTSICEKLLMANSSITYVIDKLVEKELVKRVVSTFDKRSNLIDLTDQGRSLLDAIFPKHRETIEEVFSVLTDEELEVTKELLKKIGFHTKELIQRGSKIW